MEGHLSEGRRKVFGVGVGGSKEHASHREQGRKNREAYNEVSILRASHFHPEAECPVPLNRVSERAAFRCLSPSSCPVNAACPAQLRAVIKLGETLVSCGGKDWWETKGLRQTKATMRGGAAGLAPGEEEVLGEGEIVAVAAAPGEGASAAEVAVAAGGSAHTADLHEAEPQFGTERPAPPPSPFTVLFVGANVSEQAKLMLKKEYERLRRRAGALEKGTEWWEGRVNFEYDCFADAASIMQKIKTGKPTILHFACHGDSEGVHMGGNFLKSADLAKAILAINREVPLDSRIRLVIANACMSGLLARMLSEGIDFVVGHGDFEVGDENAIVFSETLYGHMGGGSSLFASFLSAVLSSPPYQLLAPRCDPSEFFLVSESLAGRGDAVYAMPQTSQMPNWDIRDLASPDSTFSPYSMVSSSEALRRGDASNPVWNEVIQWLTQRGLEDTARFTQSQWGR